MNAVSHDADGKPYVMDSFGRKQYLTSVADARANGSNGLIHNKEFNPQTGTWDETTNWGNILGLGIAGTDAAFGLAGAAGGAGGAGGETGGAAIPGAEFDPAMVYGGSAGPTAGIPPAFGSTATDTIASGGGGGSSFGLPDWLKTAQQIGGALSAASAGRAQGRATEAGINQNQGRAAADLYRSQLDAPGIRAGQAVRGDILANAQDATITGVSPNIPVPTISGGLRPSMFSDATRQLGQSLSTGARDAQARDGFPTAPVLAPLPEASGLDSTLNTASTISNILGMIPAPIYRTIASAF